MQATFSTAPRATPIHVAPAVQDQDKLAMRHRLREMLDSQITVGAVLDLAFTKPAPGAYDDWLRDHVWSRQVSEFLGLVAPQLSAGWVPARHAAGFYVAEAYYATRLFAAAKPVLIRVCYTLSTQGMRAFAAAWATRLASRSGVTAMRTAAQQFVRATPRYVRGPLRFAAKRALPFVLSFYAFDTVLDARSELIEDLVDALIPLE